MDDNISHIFFLPFAVESVWRILLLLLLLAISAFVSGTKTAFAVLTRHDVERLERKQSNISKIALALLSGYNYVTATVLILAFVINIGAVLVADKVIDSVVAFGDAIVLEIVVKVLVIAALLLFFTGFIPEIMATRNPARFVQIVARPLNAVCKLLKPVAYLLIIGNSYINEMSAKRKSAILMDDLATTIEDNPASSDEDKKILTGIVRFVNAEVSDVMNNRSEIVALDIDSSFDEVKETAIRSGFSRIPVYTKELDNIKGVLYVKDLIPYLDNKNFQWQNIIREAYFVSDHKKLNDLLSEFQSNQVHLAIVVDEYGSTQGVISLEDILEEVVGEISDESDLEEQYYVKIDNNTYDFKGKTHISDFIRAFGLDEDFFDDLRGEAESLAGVMLEIKKDFLRVGDEVKIPPFLFRVMAVTGHRIERIRVTKESI